MEIADLILKKIKIEFSNARLSDENKLNLYFVALNKTITRIDKLINVKNYKNGFIANLCF